MADEMRTFGRREGDGAIMVGTGWDGRGRIQLDGRWSMVMLSQAFLGRPGAELWRPVDEPAPDDFPGL